MSFELDERLARDRFFVGDWPLEIDIHLTKVK
jgi:hypothetical protein